MRKKIKYLSESGVFTRIILPIILVVILVLIAWATFKKPNVNQDSLTIEETKEKTESFINNFLMSPGSKATITDITEEYGLYKVQVDIISDVVESYVTKDGKLFFPQAFNVEEMQNSNLDQQEPVNVEIPKTSKPTVELFVMSHCPYGTQIEKGILPVVKALGDKIDFELKFVDYAMHGEVELKEQMIQYCLQEEQNDKLIPYLDCFLVEGNSESCLAEVNINQNQLNTCVDNVDDEYSVMANFANNVGYNGDYPGFDVYKTDNEKYGVAGSPALIINETESPSARDSQSLLDTICGAFNNPPAECSNPLPSEAPAPGFGTATTANNTVAECN